MFFENNPSDHKTWSIWCHVGIHVVVTSILHSHIYSVGPSSVVWRSELGRALPFPPMRVLEVQGSRALSLVCEVALSMLKSNNTIKWCVRVDLLAILSMDVCCVWVQTRKYLDAFCVYFWAGTPALFSLCTFGVFVLMGHTLDAATVRFTKEW